VSNDGSRVFWSYLLKGAVDQYVYESDTATGHSVQVDVPEGGSSNPANESEEATFDMASTDGSKVFFTSNAPLTSNANVGPASHHQGYDLYVRDSMTGALTDLTSDTIPSDEAVCEGVPCGADVKGVVGASEDGSYVYVVANGVLAAGASVGNCQHGNYVGRLEAMCNLYVLHYDGSSWTTRFIARLSGEEEPDWSAENLGLMTSRVSPNGRYLAFASLANLTGYDNTDALSGLPDTEVYLYDADANVGNSSLVCVSCNPTGARPIGQLDADISPSVMDPELAWSLNVPHWLSGMLPGWAKPNLEGIGTIHQPRYLSSEGRLFFNSAEALVPQDTNGRVDVYEYEPDGIGSCGDERGCVTLISGGTGSNDSTFVDASESGNDVFFVSASQLVSQDTDNATDMYDARACTALSLCFATPPVSPPACASADACRPGPTPQPSIFGAPAS
jgi:hypothetical protein